MSKMIFLGAVVAATSVFTIPSTSYAGSKCKSGWNKTSSEVKKFFGPVSQYVCSELATDNEQAAQQCVENLEKFAAEMERMKQLWNDGKGGEGKIGSRGLAHGTKEAGNVKTERQFVGQPVLHDSYKLTINRTGGKAKNDLIVELCMVDANGNDAKYKSVRLNAKATSKTIEIANAAGLLPLIHLNNEKWGANGHEYTIRGSVKDEPHAVALAKKTLAAAKANKTGKGAVPADKGKKGKKGKK